MAAQQRKPLSTCAFEISAELQALADAALGVRGKGLLDVLHADPPRTVPALPEEPVDKNLQNNTHLSKKTINQLLQTVHTMFLVSASDLLLKNHCFS